MIIINGKLFENETTALSCPIQPPIPVEARRIQGGIIMARQNCVSNCAQFEIIDGLNGQTVLLHCCGRRIAGVKIKAAGGN